VSLDEAHLRGWIGREERLADVITAAPVAALSATLDRDDPPPVNGTVLPPLWHWLYFLPHARQCDIGPDGHPRRGGFLPPVELPRRMWAGGRLQFLTPLHVGERVQRISRIADVTVKHGRSGTLVFVLVRHEIGTPAGVAIVEEHDIVYRDAPATGEAPPPGKPAPETPLWHRDVVPDDVLLFRYSALTFNGHRIHYDRRYVTEVEGYPGLIVHGPLMATLLLDLHRRHAEAPVRLFKFRAMRPVFDVAPFTVCGNGNGSLWIRDPDGFVAMEAEAG
jgi:3-methylfumaryl-CoA hydratase